MQHTRGVPSPLCTDLSLLCPLMWLSRILLPTGCRLLVILSPLARVALRLCAQPLLSPTLLWLSRLTSIAGMSILLLATLFMCRPSTFRWHDSLLASWLLVGWGLFPLVLWCHLWPSAFRYLRNMAVSIRFFMLATFALTLGRRLLRPRHLYRLMMLRLVNMRLRIFWTLGLVVLGLSTWSSGWVTLCLSLLGNLLGIWPMPPRLFRPSYLAADGDRSVGGSDVRVIGLKFAFLAFQPFFKCANPIPMRKVMAV